MAPIKNNDLYTTPGLDTEMKMVRSGISNPINKYDYFNTQVTCNKYKHNIFYVTLNMNINDP